jgi:hypothetical protein
MLVGEEHQQELGRLHLGTPLEEVMKYDTSISDICLLALIYQYSFFTLPIYLFASFIFHSTRSPEGEARSAGDIVKNPSLRLAVLLFNCEITNGFDNILVTAKCLSK